MGNKYSTKQKLLLMLYFLISIPVQDVAAQNVNSLEYWFDGDYNNKITQTQTNTINLSVSTKGLSYGLHFLHYRVKDNLGYYSSIVSNQFFYQPLYTANATLTYWFDDAIQSSKSILLSDINNKEFQVNGTTLPFGSHYLNYSINKNNQPISTINRHQFTNYATIKASSVKPILLRYWIDNLLSSYSEENIYSSNLTDSQAIKISQNNLTEGFHSLYFQVKDNTGNWSGINTTSFTYTINESGINNISMNPLFVFYDKGDKKLIINSFETLNEVRLISLEGRLINITRSNDRKLEWDLSFCANGVYLVEIVSNNSKSTIKKFIKD